MSYETRRDDTARVEVYEALTSQAVGLDKAAQKWEADFNRLKTATTDATEISELATLRARLVADLTRRLNL